MTTKAQLLAYCADHPHIVTTGITYARASIACFITFLIGGGLGYYVRGRGIQGVKIDAENVAKEANTISTEAVAEVKAL